MFPLVHFIVGVNELWKQLLSHNESNLNKRA